MKKIFFILLSIIPIGMFGQFKVTDFTAVTSLDSNDVFYVVDNELKNIIAIQGCYRGKTGNRELAAYHQREKQ